MTELSHQVAGLPSEIETDDEDAKRFDLLVLGLELAFLRSESSFVRLRDQVKAIAGLLEEKANIPMVQQQMTFIQGVLTDEWWQDVTLPMLEQLRKRLRLLVKLIEKSARKPVYTDFEDQMGEGAEVELPGFASPDSYARFRAKARQFLKASEDHLTIRKLRGNEPLTKTDLSELERILAENSIGTADDVEKAKEECEGLGLFVRSLVGLDRQAAKNALSGFIDGRAWGGNQIQFLDEIVEHLTEHGAMEAARLYESPYTNFSPRGVDGVFASAEVDKLISILDDVRVRATA